MSDLPTATAKIQTEATRFRSAVSEAILQAMGGAINYLLNTVATAVSNITAINSLSRAVSSVLVSAGLPSGVITTVGTVTITTHGKSVWLSMQHDGTVGGTAFSNPPGRFYVDTPKAWYVYRDGTEIARFAGPSKWDGVSSYFVALTPNGFNFVDYAPSAASHTYTIKLGPLDVIDGNGNFVTNNMVLTATEILLF